METGGQLLYRSLKTPIPHHQRWLLLRRGHLFYASGAMESSMKPIDGRVQISGAQGDANTVPQVLAYCTAYPNGLFFLKG